MTLEKHLLFMCYFNILYIFGAGNVKAMKEDYKSLEPVHEKQRTGS